MLKDYAMEFAKYKTLGSKTLAQIPDDALNMITATDGNSIAMIIRHLHGNLVSRFTDFLTTDGEKTSRDRQAEFATVTYSRSEVEAFWGDAWAHLETALSELSDADLTKTITIRGEAMTVDAALCRAVAHAAYHTGQIVLLGRTANAGAWESLSIPRSK
jgi:uncharacterized damage-inducible protein DinB